MNTLAFALSFAIWVMFGPSIRGIAKELSIPLAVATLIKTLPVLVGSVMRVPIGILTDRIGARLAFPILMTVTAASVLALSAAHSASQLILGALAMGLTGTTFVIGVQSVSSWTPRARRGFALGIFGAGNVGTSITTFALPLLFASLGWRGAFRVYALVIATAALAYGILIRNAPRQGPAVQLRALLAPLANLQTWRFGLYYMATFGIFVATTLTITDIYVDAYRMSLKTAGLLATTFTCAASLCRIPGGSLADRFGARRVVRYSLLAIAGCLTPVCFGLPLPFTVALVFAAGVAMAFGMAAVFRYIPDYFPDTVGAVGGVVGALGGLGGFFLPQLGNAMKSLFGAPSLQIAPLAALALVAAAVQHLAVRRMSAAETTRGLSALQTAVHAAPAGIDIS
jgi:NNP family nitrate/nitrite transporter-like MFS transporter